MFTGALVIAGIVLLCVVIVMAFEQGENAGAWKERNEWVRSVPEYGFDVAHHFTSRKPPGIRIVDGRFYEIWEVERKEKGSRQFHNDGGQPVESSSLPVERSEVDRFA